MRLKSSSVCAINASTCRLSFGAVDSFPKLLKSYSRRLMSCWRMRSALTLLTGGGPADCAETEGTERRMRGSAINAYLLITDLPLFCVRQYSALMMCFLRLFAANPQWQLTDCEL